jgi:hypothetical protein
MADLMSFSRGNPTEKPAHVPQKILMFQPLNSWKSAVLSVPAQCRVAVNPSQNQQFYLLGNTNN